MRIGLAFDLQTDPHAAAQAEYDPPETIDALTRALHSAGHAVVPLGSAAAVLKALTRAHSPASAVRRLPTTDYRLRTHLSDVDLVFNIAEGRHGRCREAWVPTLLETFAIPYTGSGPDALALALDKVTTKRLCRAHGVPTPWWMSVASADRLPSSVTLPFPLIVKPRHEGSAVGVDAGAIVHDAAALDARVRWATSTYRAPVLIESFIAGGEATVCLIGNDPPEALPVILRPIDPATGLAWHAAKTAADDATATVPMTLTPAMEQTLQRYAVEVFTLLGCRDLARVDFRIDAQGRVYFLEINPLPNLSPADSFGLIGESLGVGYDGIIRRILEAAVARHRLAATEPRP